MSANTESSVIYTFSLHQRPFGGAHAFFGENRERGCFTHPHPCLLALAAHVESGVIEFHLTDFARDHPERLRAHGVEPERIAAVAESSLSPDLREAAARGCRAAFATMHPGEQADITRWFKALIEEDGLNVLDIRITAGRPGRVREITLDELVRRVFDSPSPRSAGKRGIG